MKHLVLIISLSFLMQGCYTPKVYDTKWKKDQSLHGIHFKKVKYIIGKESGDTLKIRGIIKDDQFIQGYPCAANYVSFSHTFRLMNFKLSRDMEIKGHPFPAGTWVEIRNDSTMLCMFQENILIGKHPCKGSKTENGAKGVHTWFYADGSLNGYFAYEDVLINGIYCEASIFHPVILFENGQLKSGMLAKDHIFDGTIFSKGSVVHFDEEGHVLSSS